MAFPTYGFSPPDYGLCVFHGTAQSFVSICKIVRQFSQTELIDCSIAREIDTKVESPVGNLQFGRLLSEMLKHHPSKVFDEDVRYSIYECQNTSESYISPPQVRMMGVNAFRFTV